MFILGFYLAKIANLFLFSKLRAIITNISFFDNSKMHFCDSANNDYRFSIILIIFQLAKSKVFRFPLSVFRFSPYLCTIRTKTERYDSSTIQDV